MQFPSSPTNGQIATLAGVRYSYDSTTRSWTRLAAAQSVLGLVTDTFAGDGTTTAYRLSVVPASPDYIAINIDGVSQLRSAYTLSGNQITFTGTPVAGAVIEVRSTTATNYGAITGLTFDSYTGDGTTVNYTLSSTPVNRNYTMVALGGIVQAKSGYSIVGSTLTFSAAPPAGAPIEVTSFGPAQQLQQGYTGSSGTNGYTGSVGSYVSSYVPITLRSGFGASVPISGGYVSILTRTGSTSNIATY